MKHLARVTTLIVETMNAAQTTTEIPLPRGIPMPQGMARFLFFASRHYCRGRPWPILLAAAEGRARIVVDVNPVKSTGGKRTLQRSVVAVFQNQLPLNATTILADSTAKLADIEALLGRPVGDITPCGRITRQKQAIQVPVDILRSTSVKTVTSIVRGIVAQYPDQRFGFICHHPHRAAIEALASPRIARIVHFGEGPDRSDNSWTRECDVICVLGTPRPGPAAVRRELIRLNDMAAASILEPVWMTGLWSGTTVEGQTVVIEGRRFHDERWQRCFEGLCRAELVQCLGRGRTILESGVSVIIVSTEAGLGLPIKVSAARVNTGADLVLNTLVDMARENRPKSEVIPNNNLLGFASDFALVKTGAIAARCKLSARAVYGYLCDLESLGLVSHHGPKGWSPTTRCSSPLRCK